MTADGSRELHQPESDHIAARDPQAVFEAQHGSYVEAALRAKDNKDYLAEVHFREELRDLRERFPLEAIHHDQAVAEQRAASQDS